ncbi:NAD(P)/FAD-dependent oxidoreductase [Rhizobium sp. SGZ-381]|uniref:NAD(P)/FAD-dependent oxidoreductase n=1 Tax=Rhizobium sp. SGZ-381 TaxID=3342800 RepID=UPI00366DAE2E
MRQPSIAIIGAGIAGLALAHQLSAHARVTLFDKSRGLGGRLATRRQGETGFDHGAQYFTVRDARFHAALEPFLEAGHVEAWNAPLMRLNADRTLERLVDRAPRFVGVPTMTALAKAMARPFEVRLNRQVLSLAGEPGHWFLVTPEERSGPFDWVLSSAPAPQTARLLPLDAADAAAVAEVRMNGCFTLMLQLPRDTQLPFEACQVAVEGDAGDPVPVISWMAANNSKPQREAAVSLVVHAGSAWSDAHLEDEPDQVRERMLAACLNLFPTIPLDAASGITLHRWRYANVERPLGRPFILDTNGRVGACGDWCIGNRVEAGFLSGHLLGETLKDVMGNLPAKPLSPKLEA